MTDRFEGGSGPERRRPQAGSNNPRARAQQGGAGPRDGRTPPRAEGREAQRPRRAQASQGGRAAQDPRQAAPRAGRPQQDARPTGHPSNNPRLNATHGAAGAQQPRGSRPTGQRAATYPGAQPQGQPAARPSVRGGRRQAVNVPRGQRPGAPAPGMVPAGQRNAQGGYAAFGNYQEMMAPPAKKRRRKWPFVVLGVIVLLAVAVGVSGYTMLNSAKTLKAQASTVMTSVSGIKDQIVGGDYAGAAAAAHKIDDTASAMQSEMDGPLWGIASSLPVVGPDIQNVRTVVATLKDASANALVPLTDALQANPPSALITQEGAIDVAALGLLLDSLQQAAPVMQRCTDSLSNMTPMNIEQLEAVMGPAREKIVGINDTFQQANAFAPLVGTLLGVDGERTYLIAAQNSAEIRSSGGFPGSMGTLKINNGAISLNDFATVYDMLTDTTPSSIQLTEAEQALFGNWMAVPRDAGFDPDFPTVANIWAASYTARTGNSVDGVIGITPCVVQKILAITGPIKLSDGTELNGQNATKVLQHDLYWKYLSGTPTENGNQICDALFAQAADLSFKQLLGNMNSETLMKFATLMMDCMESRETMMWLTNEVDQTTIQQAGWSGSLNTDPLAPEVGVFFNLWIGSKLGWYLDLTNEILGTTTNADGTVSYEVKTTFTNTVKQQEVYDGGPYIMGKLEGYQSGDMIPQIYLYAPAGGTITNLTASDGSQLSSATQDDLQAYLWFRPSLLPSKSITLTYTVTTAPNPERELSFYNMPTLTAYR